jgi:putative transposase
MGRLKYELFYARDWLNTTVDEFMAALDAYIRWYNLARIKLSLGSRTPAGSGLGGNQQLGDVGGWR